MSNISATKIASLSTLKLYTHQYFEMYSRHNGVATISESFALNL